MRVLVTRPADDGAQTAARLRALGHEPLLAPLLTTHFHDGPAPDLAGVQAVLATSANGVRAFARLSARRDLPLYAVGPQTAEAAAAAGFAIIRNADGDARALGEAAARWTTPQKGALLHVCGAQPAGRLGEFLTGQGFQVRRAMLYRVDEAAALPEPVQAALAALALEAALFYSPRSAQAFARLAQGAALGGVIAACISAATAAGLAPLAFQAVRIAARPNQDALLARLEG